MNFVSKKFKGKWCVYCVKAPATTEDHVFARGFFLLEDRHNLPKAPACRRCNEEKSRLEHYLTLVLPFGGRHAQAVAALQTDVLRRLAKNNKVRQELINSMEPAWLREGSDGLFRPTGVFTIDGPKLDALLKYVARGLTWHHWKVYLRIEDYVDTLFLPDLLAAAFEERFQTWRVARRERNDLGRGTIQYEGVQATDPTALTVWGVTMYGGVLLSGEQRMTALDNQTFCRWWIISGPSEIAGMLNDFKTPHGRKNASIIASSVLDSFLPAIPKLRGPY
jgi:hypothetical protein